MKNNHDDFCALEADCLLTSILYHRSKTPNVKLNALLERVKFLKKIILKK